MRSLSMRMLLILCLLSFVGLISVLMFYKMLAVAKTGSGYGAFSGMLLVGGYIGPIIIFLLLMTTLIFLRDRK